MLERSTYRTPKPFRQQAPSGGHTPRNSPEQFKERLPARLLPRPATGCSNHAGTTQKARHDRPRAQDREAELLGEVQVEERPPTISGVETLLTALPILKIGEVDDLHGLHPSEDDYWSPELCFVSVPIKGAKRDMLHLIDDDLAVQYLPAKKIKRHRLALACKPHDVFFFCIVPSAKPRQLLERRRARGLRAGARRIGFRRCRARAERRRRLQDRARAGSGCVSRSEMAVAVAGRTARSHVQGRQYRPRPPSRPACA